jgi:hypothetical protein
MSTRGFVKSANTSTPAARSQAELERILLRYGCSGFGVTRDYNRLELAVAFRVKPVPVPPLRLLEKP